MPAGALGHSHCSQRHRAKLFQGHAGFLSPGASPQYIKVAGEFKTNDVMAPPPRWLHEAALDPDTMMAGLINYPGISVSYIIRYLVKLNGKIEHRWRHRQPPHFHSIATMGW
jgi:hypothetical protein